MGWVKSAKSGLGLGSSVIRVVTGGIAARRGIMGRIHVGGSNILRGQVIEGIMTGGESTRESFERENHSRNFTSESIGVTRRRRVSQRRAIRESTRFVLRVLRSTQTEFEFFCLAHS